MQTSATRAESPRLLPAGVPAVLVDNLSDGHVRCTACAHHCRIKPGSAGACGVRHNRGGVLYAQRGYVAARHIRAVETNTMYHVRPGSKSLSFGMLGCDLHCGYCHNARLSQLWRDPARAPIEPISAAALVQEAVDANCEVVCAAYNEPMVTAEWAHEVFAQAKRHGLVTGMVSDGHTTPQALAYMRDVMDVYRIDLKGFDAAQYRRLGGSLSAVMDAIATARSMGYWVEVVTLVVPGLNDDVHGLRRLARHLASIDRDMPWHLNGFVPRHQMRDVPATTPTIPTLVAQSAYAHGLRYVYVGNFAQGVRALCDTYCPGCRTPVVQRSDYTTTHHSVQAGCCRSCGTPIAGIWAKVE